MKNIHVLSGKSVYHNGNKIKAFIEETLEEAIDSYIYKNSTELNLPDILTNAIMFGAKFQNELILDFLHSEITERRDYSASKMCEVIAEFIKNK